MTERWVKFKVVMSSEAFETVAQARELLESMGVSHENEAVAWGKVLELLAADFIASGWVDGKMEVP
jgi:Zn-dependent membrane protease YugP